MAEAKRTAPAPAAVRRLAPAGESGDAAVHTLLARIEVARRCGDAAKVTALTSQLAELGYR